MPAAVELARPVERRPLPRGPKTFGSSAEARGRGVAGVRLGVVLVLIFLLLVFAAPAAGRALRWYWPTAKVMRVIDGVRVRVGTRVIRIHSETTLCSGEGPSVRRRGIRMWNRFSCTFTTFTRQGVDRDLDFDVRVKGSTRFVISDAHWVGTTR
jgi:hypothetical protein